MRRPLVTIAVAASLAAVAIPMATSAGDADRGGTGPSTTDGKPIDTAPPSSVDRSEFDPEGLVDAARIGYAEFVGGFSVGELNVSDLAECPWISPADLVAAVAPIGDAAHLAPEIRSTLETQSTNGDDEVTTSDVFVTCDTEDYTENNDEATGPVYGVGIGVFDYSATAESLDDLVEFVGSSADGVVVEPSADTLGGTLYGYCEADEDSLPAGSAACFQFWLIGDFAVGMYVVTDASNPDALSQLETVVLELLPPLLQRLADGIAPVDIVSSDADDDDVAVDVDVTVTVTS